MSTNILDSVRAFVVEAFYAPADLADDASLLDTGTVDSTGVLELIMFLEKRWDIVVGDREIHPDYFDSIQRIAAFVERKLAERSEAAVTSSQRSREATGPTSSPVGSHP
ncbi:MAG: acyl carrier protein [Byssovorax sp.]